MASPIPKRSEERRRTNSPEPQVLDVGKIVADDPDSLPFKIKQDVVPPDPEHLPAGGDWHPVVRQLWESLHSSGSALYWEPSDWSMALVFCESLSRDLEEQFVGYTESGEMKYAQIPLKGASLNAYAKLAGQLMLTEGDRRRAGLEIRRDRLAGADVAAVTPLPTRRAELLGEASSG